MDVVVQGGGEFREVARRLKKAGERDLLSDLRKTVRKDAQKIVTAQKRQVRSLPARGGKHTGLRTKTAGAVRLSVRSVGGDAGVRISVVDPPGLKNMPAHLNTGHWRHKVFGNKKLWVSQSVPPGWFDKPRKDGAPNIRVGIKNVLDQISEEIAHGGV